MIETFTIANFNLKDIQQNEFNFDKRRLRKVKADFNMELN